MCHKHSSLICVSAALLWPRCDRAAGTGTTSRKAEILSVVSSTQAEQGPLVVSFGVFLNATQALQGSDHGRRLAVWECLNLSLSVLIYHLRCNLLSLHNLQTVTPVYVLLQIFRVSSRHRKFEFLFAGIDRTSSTVLLPVPV